MEPVPLLLGLPALQSLSHHPAGPYCEEAQTTCESQKWALQGAALSEFSLQDIPARVL